MNSMTHQARGVSNLHTTMLREHIQGRVILPGDADYDTARAVWNGMIDRHPAIIIQCASEEDVATALRFAVSHGLQVAVRGGGHNVAGNAVCDDGLVIDLSQMRGVRVDPDARIAYVEGGATWADVDKATQAYGLAAPGGVVSETGVAGLTLGGGLGWLRRKHGLSSDNLLSAKVITANGEQLTASETENADLFWGIRGGGGNFGIVTEFAFRLHPVGPEVMVAYVFYPVSIAKEALQFFRTWAENAPDEVSAFAVLGTAPDVPFLPEAARGQDYVVFFATYIGDVEAGKRVLEPLRTFGTPLADLSDVMPYVVLQTLLDEDYPAGEMRYYWKSSYVSSLDDDVIDVLLAQNARRVSAHSTIDIWQLGGAMSRIRAEATAFGDRSAPYLIGVEANWHDEHEDEDNISWVRDYIQALLPFSNGSQYLNFPGLFEEGEAMMRGAFGKNYARLAEIKRKYDPDNVFRLNQNVKPSGS